MKEPKKLIIVQAAADLKYAFDLIDQEKCNISLLILRMESMYQFAKSLHLGNTVKISFLEEIPLNFKRPHTFFSSRSHLRKMLQNNLFHETYDFVYFFSRFYDWMTAAMIHTLVALKKADRIIYYDHYDTASVKNDRRQKKWTFESRRNQYFICVLRFISGVKMVSRYRNRFVEFNYWDYPVQRTQVHSSPKVSKRYLYQIDDQNEKRVLFMLSPSEEEMIEQESYGDLVNIIKYLDQSGYNLYIKGHPRLGVPHKLKSFFKNQVPEYIPSEFLDYGNFVKIIGVMSSGLVYPALNTDLKVIALIQMLDFHNEEDKNFYTAFLVEHSADKIIFVKSEAAFKEHFN